MLGDRLREADRGLSPVLGVVILLGITVVLASTIGVFAFNLQDSMTGSTPQVSFTVEQEPFHSEPTDGTDAYVKTVVFTLTNGQTINTANLAVTVNGEQAYDITKEAADYGDRGDAELFPFENADGEDQTQVSLGDSIRVAHGHHPAFTDDPSTSLESRHRYGTNDVGNDPENAKLYPDGYSEDHDDVSLHAGDVVQITHISGSGGGQILFEYEVV